MDQQTQRHTEPTVKPLIGTGAKYLQKVDMSAATREIIKGLLPDLMSNRDDDGFSIRKAAGKRSSLESFSPDFHLTVERSLFVGLIRLFLPNTAANKVDGDGRDVSTNNVNTTKPKKSVLHSHILAAPSIHSRILLETIPPEYDAREYIDAALQFLTDKRLFPKVLLLDNNDGNNDAETNMNKAHDLYGQNMLRSIFPVLPLFVVVDGLYQAAYDYSLQDEVFVRKLMNLEGAFMSPTPSNLGRVVKCPRLNSLDWERNIMFTGATTAPGANKKRHNSKQQQQQQQQPTAATVAGSSSRSTSPVPETVKLTGISNLSDADQLKSQGITSKEQNTVVVQNDASAGDDSKVKAEQTTTNSEEKIVVSNC